MTAPEKLTGAPFHDLIVIYDHLDEQSGEELERKIERLVMEFGKRAEVAQAEEDEQDEPKAATG